jgi:hypothetical protein
MTEVCCECELPIEGEVIWAEGDLPFCEDCADETLIECEYCYDLRFPEHLFVYEGKCKQYVGRKLCGGCADHVDDIQYARTHGDE